MILLIMSLIFHGASIASAGAAACCLPLAACYLLHAAKDETRRQHFDAAKIKAADCLHNSGLWNGTIECQDQRHRPVYPVSALKRNECPCPSARDLFSWPHTARKSRSLWKWVQYIILKSVLQKCIHYKTSVPKKFFYNFNFPLFQIYKQILFS